MSSPPPSEGYSPDERPERQPGPSEPVTPQAVPEHGGTSPPGSVVRRPRSRGWLWLLIVLIVLGGLGVLMIGGLAAGLAGIARLAVLEGPAKLREVHVSHNPEAKRKVAVITVEGLIIDYDGFVKKQIDQAREDESIEAVVLRINSPGGTVAASDYLLHQLQSLREQRDLPLVVSMGAIAASGGYYMAMAVGDTPDALYAEPATWTGSIGVIIPHYNLHEMFQHLGVENDSIASGPLKDMGSLSRPMTEREREVFEGLVSASFERFKQMIRRGRPEFDQHPERLEQLATGQIFTAEQAEENGLVDRIGFREDAVERAVELAGIPPDRVNVVRYKPKPKLADVFMGSRAERPTLDPTRLLDLATPRAYYLCTWLPGVLESP
ncbi:MAG: signal peptide peptidase SppA [Pirellulales bacterium]